MITVYSYTVEGHYVGPTMAREDPRRPGQYIMPARTTTAPPPAVGGNKIAVWNGTAWTVEDDYRGAWYDYYTQERTDIYEVGEAPPPQTTQVEPPQLWYQFNGTVWERTLETAQAEKRAEIRDAYLDSEVSTIDYDGHTYDLGDLFVTFITIAVESAGAMVEVYDYNHNTFTVNNVKAQDIRDAVFAAKAANILNREVKYKQIEDAADIPTCDAISW